MEPVTDRTELLFVWLILDLLEAGGKAAVVVPEGLLFGSTIAHRTLRRQLLLDHKLHAVVSLPAGLFEPYSGVKTSIIVFEKCAGERQTTDPPRTEQVWFYEIAADGYTLDKKRSAQPTSENDLWDSLYKWQYRDADDKTYYQPDLALARWRLVDEDTIKIFPELAAKRGEVLGIDERFPTTINGEPLPPDPEAATQHIILTQTTALTQLYLDYVGGARANAEQAADSKSNKAQKRKAAQKAFDSRQRELDRRFRDKSNQMLEPEYGREGGFGRQALKTCQDTAQNNLAEQVKQWVSAIANEEALTGIGRTDIRDEEWDERVEKVVREYARLDGYNVILKTSEPQPRPESLPESKVWIASMRVWLGREEWESEDGEINGSHDEAGNLRPEYVTAMTDVETGSVSPDALDIDCIEANDYNLTAGRYKPFEIQLADYEPPAQIIRAIKEFEADIQAGLDILHRMMEDKI